VTVELAVGVAYAAFAAVALARGALVEAGFLAFVSGSYSWVGLGSLHVGAAPAEGAAGRYPSEIPVERLPRA
jgi:hypothetical protein